MTVWYETADQRLIDATLDDLFEQIMSVQRERIDILYGKTHETPLGENEVAWGHLNREIEVLQRYSSVPF